MQMYDLAKLIDAIRELLNNNERDNYYWKYCIYFKFNFN